MAHKKRKRKNELRLRIPVPAQIPIFPLPNVILFPEVELPLYIYEPRYRQMLADSRASHKFIGISLFKKGWENAEEPVPSHEIIGVGFIRAVFDNQDGTSYIVLRGVCRARILDYLQMEPYRIARVESIPDQIENSKELAQLARRLKKLFIQRLRWLSESPRSIPHLPPHVAEPVSLSHWVSSLVAMNDPYLKQDLLETTNPNCRVKHLIELLKEEISPPGSQN